MNNLYKENKEWRERHKERMREKMNCDICGCTVTKYAMRRHSRTNKHKAKHLQIVMTTQNITLDDIELLKKISNGNRLKRT